MNPLCTLCQWIMATGRLQRLTARHAVRCGRCKAHRDALNAIDAHLSESTPQRTAAADSAQVRRIMRAVAAERTAARRRKSERVPAAPARLWTPWAAGLAGACAVAGLVLGIALWPSGEPSVTQDSGQDEPDAPGLALGGEPGPWARLLGDSEGPALAELATRPVDQQLHELRADAQTMRYRIERYWPALEDEANGF